MSLFARRGVGDSPFKLIPSRTAGRVGSVSVSSDSALRTSAVWAAVALRADLLSTAPLNVYRYVGGVQVEVPKPPVLVSPGGDRVGINEWLYSTQVELDRTGNCFGVISERDALGNPKRIDLVDSASVTVRQSNDGTVSYRIGQDVYVERDVWHERQYTLPGLIMGLSPVAYAAWSIGQYQSAIDFGLDWFANGATVPGGVLKNSSRSVSADVASAAKTRFKESIAGRDLFVTGNDWEFSTINVASNESQFLETQKTSLADIARFFGVPADLIDVPSDSKSSITYANVVQRNLQFLVMKMGPIFVRRETALSSWLPQPRFVKFNTDSLLRMDPAQRATMFALQLSSKQRTFSEVRALDNLQPFTPAQIEELKEFDVAPVIPSPDTALGGTDGND